MAAPRVSLIAAVSRDGVIGRANGLPWHLPEDLQYFRDTTRGSPVVMGRKTFESILTILGRPLPGRLNLVVTRDPAYRVPEGVRVLTSLPAALEAARPGVHPEKNEIFVIGGAEIYRLALSLADRLYLTEIHMDVPDGDAFFPPEWKTMGFREVKREDRLAQDPPFSFVVWDR